VPPASRNPGRGTGTASAPADCGWGASAAAGPASYTVAATNSIGAGTPSQPVSVTWTTPPPGGADYCGAYNDVVEVALPWGGTIDTRAIGGMRPGTIIVGRLTVPVGASLTLPGQIRFVEYVDLQAQRQATLSTSKCDFRGSESVGLRCQSGGPGLPMACSGDINPHIVFGPSTPAVVVPGQTYYYNLRNRDWYSGQNQCGATCNGRIEVAAP